LKYTNVIFLLFLTIDLGCDVPEPPRRESGGKSPRGIVGGVETHYDSWQAVVMVLGDRVMSDGVRCTGTLVHPRVVLTAGHCVLLEALDYSVIDNPSRVSVYGGATGERLLSRAEEVSPHPDWDGVIGQEAADLALLLLEDEVTDIAPFRLRDFPMPEVGDPGVVVGYGSGASESEPSGVHRMGETTIQSLSPFFIEIGGMSNTCKGDSGGPLFTRQDDEWVVTGVTSFGAEECYVDAFGFSLNLLTYCDWLNREMRALVGEDLGLERCTQCDATPVEDWGGPCGPGYPCCGEGTRCRFPEPFSKNGLGYCAPECCAVESIDPVYCGDVAGGEERCGRFDDSGEAYCAIRCEDDGDCRAGTECQNRPYTSEKICIAKERGPGGTAECDTEERGNDGGSGGPPGENGCDCDLFLGRTQTNTGPALLRSLWL
jgi:hypothetical protein